MFPMKLHLQIKSLLTSFGVTLLPQNEEMMVTTVFWHYLFWISKTWYYMYKKKGEWGRGEAVYYSKPDMHTLIPLINNMKSGLTCFSQHFSALGSALDLQAGVSVLLRHWQPSPVSFLQVSLCPLHWHLQIKMNYG